MNDLVSRVIKERDSGSIEEIVQIIENFTDKEANLFKENYEKALKLLPEEQRNESEEYFNRIRRRLKRTEKAACVKSCNSIPDSPEKQASSTRWSIPREERKKILELMERGREEQKQRKKKNWCQLELDEFEELWKGAANNVLIERDFDIIKIDEGIDIKKDEQVNNKRTKTEPISSARISEFSFTLVDFDCIEDLLVTLSKSKSLPVSESAKFLLATADEIYRSELTFWTDLHGFDQPNFDFYAEDDDQASLKNYRFDLDDLGRFARGKSFRDETRKFYRERAYRFRYMSRKPYDLFFASKDTFKRLKVEVENLKQNSSEFSFWISSVVARRNVYFISHQPLLKAFSLFLVISRTVALSTAEIVLSLWSYRKMGPHWTLSQVLSEKSKTDHSKSKVCFLTTNKNSEIAREATKFKDVIKIL